MAEIKDIATAEMLEFYKYLKEVGAIKYSDKELFDKLGEHHSAFPQIKRGDRPATSKLIEKFNGFFKQYRDEYTKHLQVTQAKAQVVLYKIIELEKKLQEKDMQIEKLISSNEMLIRRLIEKDSHFREAKPKLITK